MGDKGVSRRAVLAGGTALLAGCAGRAPALPMDDLPHAGIARMGAAELAEGFRSRLLSPVEVARKLIERIEASQGTVNAFAHIDRATTLAAARAAEQRYLKGAPLGPLDGVPLSFKDADEFALEGWPVTYGSGAIDARTALAERDAPLVARVRGQGLVPLGITTAPDFYQCVCSTSSRTGVTRNPWNLAYGAGGSSSGAGAAAAAGLGPLHLGTDGGGSVRTPAAWCGVVGLCIGVEFSGYPVGLPGILARSVADVALLAGVMGGDAASAEGRRWPAGDYAGALGPSTLKGQRIAAWPEPSPVGVAVSADVGAVVQAAIDRVGRDAGAMAPPLPTLLDRAALVDGWTAGIAETLRQTGGMIPEARRQLADPWLLAQIAKAEAIPDATLAPMPGRYEPMIAAVAADPRLAALDIILMPTMPVGPQAAERQVPAGYDDTVIPYGLDDGGRLLGHTSMFSLLGWASASVPCGFDANGLPVGLMVGVRPGPDDLLRCLRAAHRIEALIAPPQGRRPFS